MRLFRRTTRKAAAIQVTPEFGVRVVGRRRGYYPRAAGGPGGALVLRCDLDR